MNNINRPQTNSEDYSNNIPVDAPLGTAALAKVPSDNTISTLNNNAQTQHKNSNNSRSSSKKD